MLSLRFDGIGIFLEVKQFMSGSHVGIGATQEAQAARVWTISTIGAAIPSIATYYFDLVPHSSAPWLCAAIIVLAACVATILTPYLTIRAKWIVAPAFFAILAFSLKAYEEWRDAKGTFDVQLKVDKESKSGLGYHFSVKNVGDVDVDIKATDQESPDSSFSRLASVAPRPLDQNRTMTVAGSGGLGINVGDELRLAIIYRANGGDRTFTSRFQVPESGSAPLDPVGSDEHATPDAITGATEAAEVSKMFSQEIYGYKGVLREVKDGKWNKTFYSGKYKSLIYDPKLQKVRFTSRYQDGTSFVIKLDQLKRKKRHVIFAAWNDQKKQLIFGVDGVGHIYEDLIRTHAIRVPNTEGIPVS